MGPNTRPKIYFSGDFGFTHEQIEPNILDVIFKLNSHGYKAYIVGGGVRDLLLGKKPKDFDLVTDARPSQIKRLFRNARVIGRRFKLVHIYFSLQNYLELATFRQEYHSTEEPSAYEDQNEFGSEETDAFRRDLTINGLYYDPESDEIIDYVGGVSDLQAGVIKVIGEPLQRFQEDPVRILRAVRHAVKANFSIDPLTLETIQNHSALIKNAATVRVYEELRKDLISGSAFPTLRQLTKLGLLKHIAPQLAKANFLQPEYSGFFKKVTQRADEIIWQESSERAITSILALIALALRYSKKKNFFTSFSKVTKLDIKNLVSRCYEGFALPKKEEAKIVDLLDQLRQLSNAQVKPRQIRSISKSYLKKELAILLNFLNQEEFTSDYIALIEKEKIKP